MTATESHTSKTAALTGARACAAAKENLSFLLSRGETFEVCETEVFAEEVEIEAYVGALFVRITAKIGHTGEVLETNAKEAVGTALDTAALW